MIRKIVSLSLALLLCLSLAISVSAESANIDFIVDETGYFLTDSELESLNASAAEIYESTGAGIFYVYTTIPNLRDYDIEGLTHGMDNYFVMLENDAAWYSYSAGSLSGIIPEEEEDIRALYDAEETYAGGISVYLADVADRISYVEDNEPEGDILYVTEYFVYDEADLLSVEEEAELTQKLMQVSHDNNAQVVVITIPDLNGGDIDSYLEYCYESMVLGYGENLDGVLLLVCMDPREYRILSNGYAGSAIDGDIIEDIGDEIVFDLSLENYLDAFMTFADECDYYLNGYSNGYPFDFAKKLVICLIIGVIAGLITALSLKGQLKTVRQQNQAHNYIRQGSMQVTVFSDIFMHSDVTRRRKESSSSKSGSSRSTGGGSF